MRQRHDLWRINSGPLSWDRSCVRSGVAAGKRTVAVITDMSQPLRRAVGNSLEGSEAIETLRGRGPEGYYQLSLKLAGIMIYLGGRVKTEAEGQIMAQQALHSGAGLEKLKNLIIRQGGKRRSDRSSGLLLEAYDEEGNRGGAADSFRLSMRKPWGWLQHTGAGRLTKEDAVDLSADILLRESRR